MAIKNKSWTQNGNVSAPPRWSYQSYYGFNGPNWWQGTETANVGKLLIRYRYRNWYSDSNWKGVRKSLGYLPTRTMSQDSNNGAQASIEVRIWRNAGSYWEAYRFTNLVWPHYYDTSMPPNALTATGTFIADAQNKCLRKARDMKSNIPVFLAEGRKTVDMILENARKLARAYRAFKRGNFNAVARILGVDKPVGALANNWLEWSYGWLPLVSDLKGMAEFAAQQLELDGRKPRISVSATTKSSGSSYTEDTWLAPPSPHNMKLKGQLKIGKPSYKGKAWLKLEVDYQPAALAAQLGMGSLTDLALVAWELVPFSFVFDWFVQVGQWLESAGALAGWKVLDGGVWITQDFECSISPSAWYFQGSTSGVYPQGDIGPTVSWAKHAFNRGVWSGSPPTIYAPLDDALNARRLTTLGSLWRQRLG